MSILNETLWKDIPNFENYQAHPEGEVRNKTTKRILNSESKKHKYISLMFEGKTTAKHRLIAFTFHANPNNLEQVNHKDGNTRNNKADNLEWISRSDNIKDAIKKRGRKKAVKNATLTKVKFTFKNGVIKEYNSIVDAVNDLKITNSCIHASLKRKGGFYYGSSTAGANENGDNWLWKVERIKNELTINVIEKNITIEGFTHLIACSDGRVLNKIKRTSVGSSDGRYLRTCKLKGSKNQQKWISIHQLIAQTFIPNPENKPIVNHIDGDTFNNCVSNLEWCTQSENMQHAIRTGLINDETMKKRSDKTKVPVYQLELDGSIIKKWDGMCDTLVFTGLEGNNVSQCCTSYIKKLGLQRNICGGYGWCYVVDYTEPKINKSFASLFPEITTFSNINFDAIRKYVIQGSRPLWQIDLDGKRIKLWECTKDVEDNVVNASVSNLHTSYTYGKIMSGGYSWQLASYDDILNPMNSYKKIIPFIIKNALNIADDVNIKPEIVSLLRENISSDGKFNIKTRPIVQLKLDDTILRYWSGPSVARNTLGYGRNQIESCLYGKSNKSNGYKWRYLTLEEIIICSKE